MLPSQTRRHRYSGGHTLHKRGIAGMPGQQMLLLSLQHIHEREVQRLRFTGPSYGPHRQDAVTADAMMRSRVSGSSVKRSCRKPS